MLKKADDIQKHFDDLLYALLESSYRNVVDEKESSKQDRLVLQ